MENEGVKDRLMAFLADIGWSQAKFERELGVSNGYVNAIRQSIQPDKLLKIAERFPALNISWLMVGDAQGDEMYKIPKPGTQDARVKPEPKTNGIPLIPLEAIAGPGDCVYEDERELEYYSVPAFRNSDFLIRVKGDSMTPKFTGGDLVACKKIDMGNAYFIQWNRVYVVYTQSQGVMIKRIQPSEKEDCIKCVSDNEKYAPFDVPKSDIVALALVNGSITLE